MEVPVVNGMQHVHPENRPSASDCNKGENSTINNVSEAVNGTLDNLNRENSQEESYGEDLKHQVSLLINHTSPQNVAETASPSLNHNSPQNVEKTASPSPPKNVSNSKTAHLKGSHKLEQFLETCEKNHKRSTQQSTNISEEGVIIFPNVPVISYLNGSVFQAGVASGVSVDVPKQTQVDHCLIADKASEPETANLFPPTSNLSASSSRFAPETVGDLCLKRFLFLFRPTDHENLVRKKGSNMYRCNVCGDTYRQKFSLKRHFLRSHINFRYISKADISNCKIEVPDDYAQQDSNSVCSETENGRKTHDSNNAIFLENNETRVMPGLYICHTCVDVTFDLEQELRDHYNTHSDVERKKFQCDECSASFIKKQILSRNLTSHGEQCSAESTSQAEHQRNMPSHYCDACRKRVSSKASLDVHIHKKHAGSTPMKERSSTLESVQKSIVDKPASEPNGNIENSSGRPPTGKTAESGRQNDHLMTRYRTSSSEESDEEKEERFYITQPPKIRPNYPPFLDGKISQLALKSDNFTDHQHSDACVFTTDLTRVLEHPQVIKNVAANGKHAEPSNSISEIVSIPLAGIHMQKLNLEERKKLFGREVITICICNVCNEMFESHEDFEDHCVSNHPNVQCACIEIEGSKDSPPVIPEYLRNKRVISPDGIYFSCDVPRPLTESSLLICTKCPSHFKTSFELHCHIIVCGNLKSSRTHVNSQSVKSRRRRLFGKRVIETMEIKSKAGSLTLPNLSVIKEDESEVAPKRAFLKKITGNASSPKGVKVCGPVRRKRKKFYTRMKKKSGRPVTGKLISPKQFKCTVDEDLPLSIIPSKINFEEDSLVLQNPSVINREKPKISPKRSVMKTMTNGNASSPKSLKGVIQTAVTKKTSPQKLSIKCMTSKLSPAIVQTNTLSQVQKRPRGRPPVSMKTEQLAMVKQDFPHKRRPGRPPKNLQCAPSTFQSTGFHSLPGSSRNFRKVMSRSIPDSADSDYDDTEKQDTIPEVKAVYFKSCPFCKKTFSGSLILDRHIQLVHNRQSENSVVKMDTPNSPKVNKKSILKHSKRCPICKEKFTTNIKLYSHIQMVHSRRTNLPTENIVELPQTARIIEIAETKRWGPQKLSIQRMASKLSPSIAQRNKLDQVQKRPRGRTPVSMKTQQPAMGKQEFLHIRRLGRPPKNLQCTPSTSQSTGFHSLPGSSGNFRKFMPRSIPDSSDSDFDDTEIQDTVPKIKVVFFKSCPICKKTFSGSLILDRHIQLVHKRQSENSVVKMETPNSPKVNKKSIRKHSKRCPMCKEKFAANPILYNHIQMVHSRRTNLPTESIVEIPQTPTDSSTLFKINMENSAEPPEMLTSPNLYSPSLEMEIMDSASRPALSRQCRRPLPSFKRKWRKKDSSQDQTKSPKPT